MSGPARPQSLWTLGRAVLVAVLALVSVPPGPAGAVDSRAAATQDGWWNRLQGPADGEPDSNPVRPLVPALPKPPTVPADAITAGATAGQVDKVAAVGLDLTLADSDTLQSLVLRLEESTGPGANVGADRAKVIACPATVPWGPGQNAAWQDRPAADCELGSVDGVRAADGLWTFDLTAVGRLWADPFAPLARNGVVLAVDPIVSPSAQVSWLNVESGHVAVDLAATPGGAVPPVDDEGRPGPWNAAAARAPTTAAPGYGPGAGAFPSAAGGGPLELPRQSFSRPVPDAAPAVADPSPPEAAVPAEPPAGEAPAAGPDRPGPELRARAAVGFWENLPGATTLLVPVTVGLALLVGLALGPAGRPAPVFRREGGLSRALARRTGGGDGGAGSPADLR